MDGWWGGIVAFVIGWLIGEVHNWIRRNKE